MPNPKQTHKKIEDFRELKNGWYLGEGVAPSETTIKNAHLLNEIFSSVGFSKTDAFPGVGGQIQVNGYWDDIYLEFYIEMDGEIIFTLEHNDQELVHEDNLSLLDAVSRIMFWGKEWATSELSRQKLMILKKEDFLARLLADQAMVVSLLLTRSASKPRERNFASTSPFTTQIQQETYPFTDMSPQKQYQRVAAS